MPASSQVSDADADVALPALLDRSGNIALFLDFDGVLAEIAPTPDSVEVTGQTIARLQSLNSALDGALAIVSGRDIAALDGFLAPLSLAVAGDHGNARRGSDGHMVFLNAGAGEAALALHEAMSARFGDDPRVVIEHKPSAVAVHYRLAPERSTECIEALSAGAAEWPQLSIIAGQMVIEARATGANKGVAVRGFMEQPPFTTRTPIFVGDDVTDEDGFIAAQDYGGAGIKVGFGDTAAHYRIGGTGEVGAVLDAILASQRGMN